MTPAAARAAAVTLRARAVAWARSAGLANAEDVAHDAIEVLLRRAEDVPPESAVAFLRQVVFNKVRESRRHPVAEPVEQASGAPSPEDTLVSAQLSRRLNEALACVSPSRRDVVRLVSIEGRTVPDVAASEGMPESTVRARLRDGTADLRAELTRRRAEERRKSGFSSWLAAWGILDLRVWARRSLAALGAATAGGALAAFVTSGETLASTPEEQPAMAFEVPSVSQPTTAWAERSQERVTAEVMRPRERHDAGRRFRAERFGPE